MNHKAKAFADAVQKHKEALAELNKIRAARPRFKVIGHGDLAELTDEGSLEFNSEEGPTLNAKDAKRFANWILDIFK